MKTYDFLSRIAGRFGLSQSDVRMALAPLTLGGECKTGWRQQELFVKNERSVSEPMTLDSQQRKYLEIIVVGLPHLAEAIAAIPFEHQAVALDAAGRRYLKTFRQLGLSEPES